MPWLCLLVSSGKQKTPKQIVYLVLLRKELKVNQKTSAQHGIGSWFVPTLSALCNADIISKRYSESSKCCRERDAQRYGVVSENARKEAVKEQGDDKD